MKKIQHILPALALLCLFTTGSKAQADSTDSLPPARPDTAVVGIYITSIHDIDFKEKEFAMNCWVWIKYKDPNLDFVKHLEVPQAKSVDMLFSHIKRIDSNYLLQMKLQCVMKDSWRIDNFPFDHQQLRLSFENSEYDSTRLIFIPDTAGENYNRRFTLRGWKIDSAEIYSDYRKYETSFGEPYVGEATSSYSAFRVTLIITRDALGLFWKLFLGMYIAFFIAFACFFIHTDSMDSRFGLSVGALFAVIGNKYVIDSSLAETTSFTLVDTLHGITLAMILVVISSTIRSQKLVKNEMRDKALRFDRKMARILLLVYAALNIFFILMAYYQVDDREPRQRNRSSRRYSAVEATSMRIETERRKKVCYMDASGEL